MRNAQLSLPSGTGGKRLGAGRKPKGPRPLVSHALAYVLGNDANHFGGKPGADRFSSATYDALTRERVLCSPRTWLIRDGWRRAKRIPQWLAAAG